MIETVATLLSPALNFPLIRRVRRNHGLEHATIHMLSRQIKNLRMAGRADNEGFVLYGEADTEIIRKAVDEALHRMQSGEHSWAVHPNCGTGLVTSGFLTSMAALIGLIGTKDSFQSRLERLPLMLLFSIVALVVSQPLGLALQRHITTLGDPGDLEVIDISRHEMHPPLGGGPLTVHRIRTRYG